MSVKKQKQLSKRERSLKTSQQLLETVTYAHTGTVLQPGYAAVHLGHMTCAYPGDGERHVEVLSAL